MRVSGEYRYAQIGFLPFWEKPPLFFWIQAASMALWGETEWAARLPNVLIMGITLWLLYFLGKRWHGPFFGWLWVFLWYGAPPSLLYPERPDRSAFQSLYAAIGYER